MSAWLWGAGTMANSVSLMESGWLSQPDRIKIPKAAKKFKTKLTRYP